MLSGSGWRTETKRCLIQKLFLFFNLISVVKNPSLHPKYVRHVQNRIHYVIHGNTNRIARSYGTSYVYVCVRVIVCVFVCMCVSVRAWNMYPLCMCSCILFYFMFFFFFIRTLALSYMDSVGNIDVLTYVRANIRLRACVRACACLCVPIAWTRARVYPDWSEKKHIFMVERNRNGNRFENRKVHELFCLRFFYISFRDKLIYGLYFPFQYF